MRQKILKGKKNVTIAVDEDFTGRIHIDEVKIRGDRDSDRGPDKGFIAGFVAGAGFVIGIVAYVVVLALKKEDATTEGSESKEESP